MLTEAARRSMKLREFAQVFFAGVPALQAFSGQVDEMMATFNEYKLKVPVMGVILLDAELEHCLLVKGMKANASWGFPKGKRDKGEKDIDCAAREVLEETNFDASELLKEEWSIEVTTKKTGQRTKLYILPGVDKATPFEPRCRGEISEYAWFPVEDLPAFDGGNKVFTEDDGSRHNFFKVQPFTFALREWIKKRKKKGKKKKGKGAGGGGAVQSAAPAIQVETEAPPEPVSEAALLRKNLRQGEVPRPNLHPWANFRFQIEPIREGFRNSFGGQDWW